MCLLFYLIPAQIESEDSIEATTLLDVHGSPATSLILERSSRGRLSEQLARGGGRVLVSVVPRNPVLGEFADREIEFVGSIENG